MGKKTLKQIVATSAAVLSVMLSAAPVMAADKQIKAEAPSSFSQASGIGEENTWCVDNNGKLWVAGSESDHGLFYSDDGEKWEKSNIENGYFYSLKYADDTWLAGFVSTDEDSPYVPLLISSDGKEWKSCRGVSNSDTDTEIESVNDIEHDGEEWLIATDDGLYASKNLSKWRKVLKGNFSEVEYEDDMWIVLGNQGITISHDKKDWKKVNGSPFKGLAYEDGTWAVGSKKLTNGIFISHDGESWRKAKNTDGHFYSIKVLDNGTWIACCASSDNLFYYSDNGIYWKPIEKEKTDGKDATFFNVSQHDNIVCFSGTHGIKVCKLSTIN